MIFIGKRGPNLGSKKRTVERRVTFGPNSVKVVLAVLFVAFAFFYLSQSSQSANRNYIVSDLEQRKDKAEAVKAQLEVDGNRLKALSLIQEKAKEMGLEQEAQAGD